MVEIDGDDARSLPSHRREQRHDTPSILATAVYEDELRRTPDGWRFVHRKVVPDTAIQH